MQIHKSKERESKLSKDSNTWNNSSGTNGLVHTLANNTFINTISAGVVYRNHARSIFG